MLIKMKTLLPNNTLIRKRKNKVLLPSPIFMEEKKGSLLLYHLFKSSYSFNGKGNLQNHRSEEILPKIIDIDENFKLALVAYLCEGDKPEKGGGYRLGLNNSDWWIIKLVIDQFEKLGIKRARWNVRLELYINQHDEIKEKNWWSQILQIPIYRFTTSTWYESVPEKKDMTFHGRARIQLFSIIFASIIRNLLNKLKEGKL